MTDTNEPASGELEDRPAAADDIKVPAPGEAPADVPEPEIDPASETPGGVEP